ncbi:MAG TPA: serine/threonine-protein kinase [Gemmataceae bacterium]|nr:serine/threonine-protein kinase [Gemmataceae bacterium]
MNQTPGARPQIASENSSPPQTVNSPRRHCRVALMAGSTPQLTQAIEALLRTRLLMATLIFVGGFAGFLILGFFNPPQEVGPLVPFRIVQCSVTLILALLAALLWSKSWLSFRWLRIVEMTFFGIVAGYFAWMHYLSFRQGVPAHAAATGKEAQIVRMANMETALRWFALLAVYGAFIPNTWRRSLVVVGVLTAFPVAMTVWLCLFDDVNGLYLRNYVGDMAVTLLVGCAIAIFGSHKISELHARAFEAAELGHYRLKKRLGAGGMGEVYLAEHLLLRRPCAIKLIRPEQAGDARVLRRFEREVQAMATLTHWNTVEIYDYGHAECGSFYYVMEYLPGWSLEDLVGKHGPLPPARVVHILRQVCHALREAHGVGLIHRDIKSSNIITCERGKVYDVAKLLDFGLVKDQGLAGVETRLTQQGLLTGTPAYMSPEQAMGLSDLDARSDIYSLGAVAYYLLTGSIPFERPTIMQVLTAHARDPVVPPGNLNPDIPSDLQEIVLRCLEKDPARRYPDAESLEQDLAACRCSGQWTPKEASSWWEQHELPAEAEESMETPDQVAPTVLASPAAVARAEAR